MVERSTATAASSARSPWTARSRMAHRLRDRVVHDVPSPALVGERAPPRRGELVVLAHPAVVAALLVRGDQIFVLHAVEDGIEHALGPLELPAAELADRLDERVAVARAL